MAGGNDKKSQRRTPKKGSAPDERERRLRALDETVKRALADEPALADRLRAHLAGQLPTIKQDRTLTIRLPAALVERVEALIPDLVADPAVTAARGGSRGIGLSAVVRMALLEGLGILERRHKRGR